jgi:ketosteroid isomerase-like protein
MALRPRAPGRVALARFRGGAALAMLLAVAAPPPSFAGEAEAAIEARLVAWTEDFNARRYDRLCELFSADLVADYQGEPQKDRDTLCAGLRQLAGVDRTYRYALDIHEVIVSGDLAVVRLTWTLTVTGHGIAGEATVTDVGLDVFRREADGAWRIARFVAFPTRPQ